ncbi:phage tail protein [Paracoccaceae bacterium Fryx2]|nr:phage tail protein [Paracoccaceae bacterium Fryx2]
MRAHCITVTNPFDPLGSREARELRRPVRIRTLAPAGGRPVLALLNGRPLLRAGWRRRLRSGDRLMFCVLPRGPSDGGGGGSNPLRMILSLAMMAFAPWAAATLLGTTTALVGTTLLGQATTMGIMMVGQAVVNALLPMPKPPTIAGPSPTYTIGAQGNLARIEQAIPVQYGRLLAWPDFAAQPYAEYADNEQYLYQLLCLGVGEFDIEEIRIEDTPISAFAEIETEIVPPGAQVTLFPTSVVTSVEVSGQELAGRTSGSYARSGTVITVTETAHGRAVGQAVRLEVTSGGAPSMIYAIATVPTVDTFTVVAAAGSGSGDTHISGVAGGIEGFVASDVDSMARRLSIDLVFPLGLYSTSSSGLADMSVDLNFQARQVDGNGDPVGPWITLGLPTITDRSATPLGKTLRYTLPTPGRYRVRAFRRDVKSATSNEGHQVMWSGLRAYLRETQDFGPVTLIALRMRATNNLSQQASRRIGVLATRKIPVWNGTAWSAPVASRSIAWAIADAARNADYGAGLPDTRLDLAALLALDALWGARGDSFNARFDQAGSWWEAVSKIAAAGRARIFMQGGMLRVVRDGPASLPVALYSMRNIKRGSFSVDYLLPSEQTADALSVSYFDQVSWSPRRVTARLPGSAGTTPAKMDLFGVTDRAQVLREGLYHAAANRYRRRIARFATEMEGFIPSLGDLIALQHDTPGWGAQAEAVAWDAGSRKLVLSEPVSFGPGAHYIGLRTKGGGVSGPWQVTPGPDARSVILAEAPDRAPYTGSDRERSHVVFGAGQTWAALAKVASVRPRGLYEVEIEAVIEDPSVHTAETGQTAPPLRISSLPRRVVQPVLRGLIARRVAGDPTRAFIAWQPAAGAEVYQIEMAEGDNVADPTVSWTRTADTSAAHHVVALLYTTRTLIRVRGVGLAAGPWVASAVGSLIAQMWISDPTLMWTTDPNPMWSA